MSPIDEELRAALHGRASVLAPSPDPLAGIERRAKRIRRNRVAASVTGTALAVAAIAVVVPTLASSTTTMPDRPPVATLAPSPEPTVSSYALDPADPWDYRGDPQVLEDGNLDTFASEWALRHPDESLVEFVPLYGELFEPSAQVTVVFLARTDGQPWWGVVETSESGPEFLLDTRLADGTTALPAALPGDEVARLLVVAAPDVGAIEYGANDATEFVGMADIAPGVGITPLEGDPSTDQVRVSAPNGDVIYLEPAPDFAGDPDPPTAGQPTNLLTDWPVRGDSSVGPPVQELLDAFVAAVRDLEPDGEPQFRALFTGDTDSGLRFTLGQAWMPGRQAYTVGYTTGGESGPELFVGTITESNPAALGLVLCCAPGTTTDTLVIVPEPGTGQVEYASNESAAFEPVTGQDFLDGVVLIDRDPRAMRDRIRLLDGNGDLDNPTYEGPISTLLCGVRECG